MFPNHQDLLQEYLITIGRRSLHPFLDMFGLSATTSRVSRPLWFQNLQTLCGHSFKADRQEILHVVAFVALPSPCDLTLYATDCRRDLLAVTTSVIEQGFAASNQFVPLQAIERQRWLSPPNRRSPP